MPPEIAAEIVTTKRQRSTQVRLSGFYRVGKVDTTAPDGFRVTLFDEKTGEEITASLIDTIISAEHRHAIQEAEWRKQPVFVELTARKLRRRIVDAVAIGAKPASTSKPRLELTWVSGVAATTLMAANFLPHNCYAPS